MKYISEFRDSQLAKVLLDNIEASAHLDRCYKFMEFCGGHTHTIHRYGIPSLLPKNVEMIHGPGCPVCVLPIARIDHAIALAQMLDVIFCSYGDMLRVPATHQDTLLKAKARGANIRMVYSALDVLIIAQQNPKKSIIFFAIGFETTTPPTAYILKEAKKLGIKNLSVFCNHVLTPAAMKGLLETGVHLQDAPALDGFVGPAHVSIIIGTAPYADIANKYQKPIVISGFEPLDVLHSILMLIDQVNKGRAEIENQYTRAVNKQGNCKSQQLIAETMQLRDRFEWRGLGWLEHSALAINKHYQEFDAEYRFNLPLATGREHKACECAAVLRGAKKPTDCKLFAKVCTPENPLGSCMVSSEGACAAVYAYGRKF